ncbi:MAG: RNA polymerase subunit Rpo13 [Metallosphaera sp.]|uniref:RNA polymerase subunit Rpo13 n=1 Tax=Metallosphaera sp. TaxID=2020860 RepID=UPI00315EC978
MSEDFEEESEPQVSSDEVRVEDEDEGIPAMSLQDIELLTKNTDIWHRLIAGKISIDEAKKEFEANNSLFESKTEKNKVTQSKRKTTKKVKKAKKSKEE